MQANAEDTTLPASPSSGFAARFIDWMYLPPAKVSLLRRLVGLACLPIGFLVWHWTHGGPGPYVIPAWRFHQTLFVPPLPPDVITTAMFTAGAMAAVWLAAGTTRKWVIAVLVLILAYFGCRDFWAIGSHFSIMLWTFLIALLFDKPGKNCSRRLIQLSIFFCYFFSAFQKMISPDFMSGYSIEAEMADGWSLNGFWQPILHLQSVPHFFWLAFSWVTVVLEYFLAFGLMSQRFRKAALWLGLLFHIGIAVLLDFYIFWFSVVMLIGYIAFFPIKEEHESAADAQVQPSALEDAQPHSITKPACTPDRSTYLKPGPWELALASGFVLSMVFIPLRIYFFPERDFNDVVMLDRTPWSFCMFLQRLDDQHATIKYKTADGTWKVVALDPKWRTKAMMTDNELYSASSWIFHRYPDALETEIQTEFSVNKRWHQHKTLHATRAGTQMIKANRQR